MSPTLREAERPRFSQELLCLGHTLLDVATERQLVGEDHAGPQRLTEEPCLPAHEAGLGLQTDRLLQVAQHAKVERAHGQGGDQDLDAVHGAGDLDRPVCPLERFHEVVILVQEVRLGVQSAGELLRRVGAGEVEGELDGFGPTDPVIGEQPAAAERSVDPACQQGIGIGSDEPDSLMHAGMPPGSVALPLEALSEHQQELCSSVPGECLGIGDLVPD